MMREEDAAEAAEIDAPENEAENENQEQQEQSEQEPASVEDIASRMGWSPQDNWRGDPGKWKPADEFLTSTVDINKKLIGKVDGLEGQISQMARTSAQITQNAVERAKEEALAERSEAFESGDAEAFNKADAKLARINQAPAAATEPPETQQFIQDNASWYGVDQEATAYAQARTAAYFEQGLSPARQLMLAKRDVENAFPEHFKDEKPKPRAAPLNKPGARGGTIQKKGYSSLPADVKAAADDYANRGVCTKEEYAEEYYQQESGQ